VTEVRLSLLAGILPFVTFCNAYQNSYPNGTGGPFPVGKAASAQVEYIRASCRLFNNV